MKLSSLILGLSPLLPMATAFSLILPQGTTTRLQMASSSGTSFAPSEELLKLYNDQITKEFTASQTYLSASIWFETRDWEGMASYMLAESAEERGHALQFVEFANKRDIAIDLQQIPAPIGNWDTPEQVWEDILELEQSNTISLLKVAEAANKCQDYAVMAFLNPFHMEQVDSEDTIGTIVAKVQDENKTPGLLRQLDHELGEDASATTRK